MKPSYRFGFSLLELLISLAILGLLVQWSLPYYGVFVEKARARERAAILISLQTEIEICYFSERDYETCAERLQVEKPHALAIEADRLSYHMVIESAHATDWCHRFETNSAHEWVAEPECIF